MANKRLIKFYQGYVLPEVRKSLRSQIFVDKDDLNIWFKTRLAFTELSVKDFTNEQLTQLIIDIFILVEDKLNLYLNFPNNEYKNEYG